MPETHFREVGADPCLTLCSIASSFNSIKAAAAVLSLLCHGFCLMMLQCFQQVNGLKCMKASSPPGLFHYQAMLL